MATDLLGRLERASLALVGAAMQLGVLARADAEAGPSARFRKSDDAHRKIEGIVVAQLHARVPIGAEAGLLGLLVQLSDAAAEVGLNGAVDVSSGLKRRRAHPLVYSLRRRAPAVVSVEHSTIRRTDASLLQHALLELARRAVQPETVKPIANNAGARGLGRLDLVLDADVGQNGIDRARRTLCARQLGCAWRPWPP